MKYSGEIVDLKSDRIVRSTVLKDRHSKVRTSKGTRDRRLRLSAHTAIQFYDVQDRLGYDRPSNAVDWLMKNAKSAIDELELKGSPLPAAEASSAFFAEAPNIPKDLRLSLQSFQDGSFGHQNPAFFLSSDNQRMAFGQGQIFNQRESLQSSNLSLFRPWMENVDHEMINPSSSCIGFSGFRIPARIRGEDELDCISQKMSPRSSASYH